MAIFNILRVKQRVIKDGCEKYLYKDVFEELKKTNNEPYLIYIRRLEVWTDD